MIEVQLATWSRCCVLGLSLLDGFEQAANSVDKNSKKCTETLDHRKLLNGWEFLQTLRTYRSENVRIVQQLASLAVRFQKDEYAPGSFI